MVTLSEDPALESKKNPFPLWTWGAFSGSYLRLAFTGEVVTTFRAKAGARTSRSEGLEKHIA